jgi:hypothetical protein
MFERRLENVNSSKNSVFLSFACFLFIRHPRTVYGPEPYGMQSAGKLNLACHLIILWSEAETSHAARMNKRTTARCSKCIIRQFYVVAAAQCSTPSRKKGCATSIRAVYTLNAIYGDMIDKLVVAYCVSCSSVSICRITKILLRRKSSELYLCTIVHSEIFLGFSTLCSI